MARTKTEPETQPGLYVATATGVIKIDGDIRRYLQGKTHVRANDPILRALPGRFRPMTLDLEPEVRT